MEAEDKETSKNTTAADQAISELAKAGVEVCFMNPGTSEMHLVAAIDNNSDIRGVLGLFEGVVTGAADGYGRISDKPAMTLLHLGPGLANGLANLHNAKRAGSPILNIIGDHAISHMKYDAPLASDIASLSKTVSYKTYEVRTSVSLAPTCLKAHAQTMENQGQITTVIVPANCAWESVDEFSLDLSKSTKGTKGNEMPKKSLKINEVADALRSGEKCLLLLGGNALDGDGLDLAGKVAKSTGCGLSSPTFSKKRLRGVGVIRAERLPYFGDMVLATLKDVKHLILVGAKAPVSFFAYEGAPSNLVPQGCHVHKLASPSENAMHALEQLAIELNCQNEPAIDAFSGALPAMATGKLDGLKIGIALANLMPEGCIVSDESNTNGIAVRMMTILAKPHQWMDLTGGSIGQGMPLAIGAAIARPDKKVIALQADGSAMYTLQSLWTIARENLDITIVLFSNKSYAILNVEFAKLGLMTQAGDEAKAMMSLDRPEIDFVGIAVSLGVDAAMADTAEEFNALLEKALNTKGAFLIDAKIDPPM
jgi:acetolactate synthase-1/2/3 large subunit